jgi:hypothetical protein
MNRTQEILAHQNHEREWNAWRDAMNSLPQDIRSNVRNIASKDLAQHIPDGHGISSSDINHHMFSLWKRSGQHLVGFFATLVEIS